MIHQCVLNPKRASFSFHVVWTDSPNRRSRSRCGTGIWTPDTWWQNSRSVEIKSCVHFASRSIWGPVLLSRKESVNHGRFERGSILPNGTCPEFRIRGVENLETCFVSNFCF
ncbi:hypothetical protein CEXT_306871 [Caerostris extrusa]|uniref:Uncharacterized protein n=1 Tax=Caerostris extrusa TaxID=172846 RepID=A0AAV4YAP6_CAEEX|nr:hypothetical protein CEXT_306871 [Caerostris extrusa]